MEDPCGESAVTTELMAFRVGAIFLILACSGLGVSLTLVGKHMIGLALPAYALLFFKTLGTGILLACALVHLLLPANESLTSPCLPAAFSTQYKAYAYLYCMLAFMGMQFITNGLAALARKARRRAKECRRCEDNVRPDQDVEALAATAAASAPEPARPAAAAAGPQVATKDLLFSDEADTPAGPLTISLVDAIAAEIAFSVHSVIIGITIGLAQDPQFKTLLIALSFHQFFEGVALGARLFAASFRGLYDLSFLAFFSLAAPVGMAVGVGLLRGGSLNANGGSFLMTQGTLDGVTSGLLLHIAAAKLVVDFQRDVSVVSRDSWVRAFGLHVAVSVGAGCMAYLGKFL
jgi:zinc transporter 1/2/3